MKVSVKSGRPNPTARNGNPLTIVAEGGELVAKDDALQISRTGLQEVKGKLYDSFEISEANGAKAEAILKKAGDEEILHDPAANRWFTWSRKEGEAPVEMAPPPIGRSPNGQFLVFAEAKRTRPIHDGVGIADMRRKVDVAMNHFKADLKRVSDENAVSRKERVERFEASWKGLPDDVASAVKYEKDGEDFSFTVDETGAGALLKYFEKKENRKDFNAAFGKLPGDVQVKLNGAFIRLSNGATGEFKWRISQMSREGARNLEAKKQEAEKQEAEKLEKSEKQEAEKPEKPEAKKQEAENKEAQKQEAKKQEPGTQENAKADVRVFVVNLSNLDAEAAKKKMIDAVSKKANSGNIGTIDFKEIDLGENCKITKKEFEEILGEVATKFNVDLGKIRYETRFDFNS
ncbi:MAG TPA: hypothetical protein PLZ86_09450 [bacterium]|nr:hypothetical protein [bacterium]